MFLSIMGRHERIAEEEGGRAHPALVMAALILGFCATAGGVNNMKDSMENVQVALLPLECTDNAGYCGLLNPVPK